MGPDPFRWLRMNRIDNRDYVRPQMVEDWTFTDPGAENAATWHYYLYLASLDTPDAMDRLTEKIATTEDGNTAKGPIPN